MVIQVLKSQGFYFLIYFGLIASMPMSAQTASDNPLMQVIESASTLEDSLDQMVTIAEREINRQRKNASELIETCIQLATQNDRSEILSKALLVLAKLKRSEGKHQEALALVDSLLESNSFTNDVLLEADARKLKANMLSREDAHVEAELEFQKVLAIYRAQNDTNGVAFTYRGLSSIARNTGNFPLALDYCQQAIDLFKQTQNDEGLANVYNSMGILYKDKTDWEKSKEAYQESLKYHEKTGNKAGIANALANLGNVSGVQKNDSQSIEYFEQALVIFTSLGNKRAVATISYNISVTQKSLGQLEKALENNQLSYNTFEEMGNTVPPPIIISLGELYAKLGDAERAAQYLKSGISKAEESGQMNTIKNGYNILSQSYAKIGDYKSAWEAEVSFKNTSDSLFNEEMNTKYKELETTYEVKEKDGQIALLEEQKKQQRKTQYFTLGILLLSLVIGFLLWNLGRVRKKANALLETQKNEIEEKNERNELLLREIHHRVKNNLQFISSLLGLQSEHLEEGAALNVLKEGQDRVYSMALIHQNLYQEDNLTGISVTEYLEKLTENLFHSYNISPDRVKLKLNIDEVNLDVDTMVPLGLIINELVSNSLKYAFPNDQNGMITVTLKELGDHIELKVSDDGIGLGKAGESALSHSFGYRLIHAFKSQLEADLEILSDQGTTVTLSIQNYKKAG